MKIENYFENGDVFLKIEESLLLNILREKFENEGDAVKHVRR